MSPVDGPRDDPTLGPGEEQGRASRPPFESFSSEGRQRDLLPLPHVDVPRAPSGLSLSRGTRQRSSRAGYLARGVNEAVSAINDLYGGTRNPPSSATPAQLEVLEDIRGRLQQVPVPEARPSPQEAARELLGLGLAYTGEETGMHIGKYDRDLVALPSVKEPPPNVREVLDPEALDIVVNFQQKMLLAPDEWESLSRSTARIVPYTDVVLAKRRFRLLAVCGGPLQISRRGLHAAAHGQSRALLRLEEERCSPFHRRRPAPQSAFPPAAELPHRRFSVLVPGSRSPQHDAPRGLRRR